MKKLRGFVNSCKPIIRVITHEIRDHFSNHSIRFDGIGLML